MDLGIKGRNALVCAASKGLGRGCAMSLAREGANVTIVARGREALEQTAADIRSATGARVAAVAADITTAEGRAAALAACPQPDILVNNAGGPPPGDFREWKREDWIKAVDANMLTPIELIKATVDGMIARKFGRVDNIMSNSGRVHHRPELPDRRGSVPRDVLTRSRAGCRAPCVTGSRRALLYPLSWRRVS